MGASRVHAEQSETLKSGASSLRRAEEQSAPGSVLDLQRKAGNQAVGRLLSRQQGVTGKMAGGAPAIEKMQPISGRAEPVGEAPPRLTKVTVAEPQAGGSAKGAPNATGAGFKTISPATGFASGGFSWVIQWVLDKPSTKGGWIVQGVKSTFDIKNAAGQDVDVLATTGTDPSWWPMWEAWQVHPGQSVTTYAETGDLEDDTYGSPSMGDETKGKRTVQGTAQFYEGATLPSDFKATNQAPAWILPTTKTSPAMTGGTGSIDHSLTATWDSITPSTTSDAAKARARFGGTPKAKDDSTKVTTS